MSLKHVRRCCVLLLPALLGACRAAELPADFERGMEALRRGDYAEAYCLWKPQAERGLAEAQYHVGWLYANGNGLAVDVEQAIAWWTRAADQGHPDAQFAIGLAYTTGEGMDKDLDQAVEWYLAAARQGHQDARDILARLNGDPAFDLLDRYPELTAEPWFGWRVKVRRDRINLRAKPGTDSKVVTQLDAGAQLRVIGQRKDWYQVVLPDNGDTAWIFRNLVRKVPD